MRTVHRFGRRRAQLAIGHVGNGRSASAAQGNRSLGGVGVHHGRILQGSNVALVCSYARVDGIDIIGICRDVLVRCEKLRPVYGIGGCRIQCAGSQAGYGGSSDPIECNRCMGSAIVCDRVAHCGGDRCIDLTYGGSIGVGRTVQNVRDLPFRTQGADGNAVDAIRQRPCTQGNRVDGTRGRAGTKSHAIDGSHFGVGPQRNRAGRRQASGGTVAECYRIRCSRTGNLTFAKAGDLVAADADTGGIVEGKAIDRDIAFSRTDDRVVAVQHIDADRVAGNGVADDVTNVDVEGTWQTRQQQSAQWT